ncbi:MAG: arginine--tRNA ligase, partial [Lachnospiraceae bacterium]|nr:arginine--tRNA ligase [Lachnospiraceae bacterium]
SKDYVFDIDRFTSFEGDTGPYILYTIVRIKSILGKYREQGGDPTQAVIRDAQSEAQKALMLELAKFNTVIESAYADTAPHKICAYIYDVANAFNRFYHETKILTAEDEDEKAGYIALLGLTKEIFETCIGLLAFDAPEKM